MHVVHLHFLVEWFAESLLDFLKKKEFNFRLFIDSRCLLSLTGEFDEARGKFCGSQFLSSWELEARTS